MLASPPRRHLLGMDVRACGIRADSRSHDGSDPGLTLHGPGAGAALLGRLAGSEEALQVSNIPFPVGARDRARRPEPLRRAIVRDRVGLRESGEREGG